VEGSRSDPAPPRRGGLMAGDLGAEKLSMHHMLIVFDSKSSLAHYTFDKMSSSLIVIN
jgi:hypothetical protein